MASAKDWAGMSPPWTEGTKTWEDREALVRRARDASTKGNHEEAAKLFEQAANHRGTNPAGNRRKTLLEAAEKQRGFAKSGPKPWRVEMVRAGMHRPGPGSVIEVSVDAASPRLAAKLAEQQRPSHIARKVTDEAGKVVLKFGGGF